MIGQRTSPAIFLLLLPIAAADELPTALPSAEQIVDRMSEADAARSSQLQGYTTTRVYQLDNHRFHKQAKITAQLTYRSPGVKSFEVMQEEGSRLICDRVLRRVIAAETDASRDGNRDLARINLVNYNLKVLGRESTGGRDTYVLALEPKSKSPYLVKGKAWIDADEYALVRLEGVVAKRPSVWVGSPVVRQTYIKMGALWLPEKNQSTTDAPVFGKTDLDIESSGYQIQTQP